MVLSFKQFSADSLDWSHQIGGLEIPKPGEQSRNQQEEERKRTPPLKCPRCDSTNTKFCYYNNYSRLQPRHFCRACKRHWTHGGTLRHVPVGGVRKTKRAKTTHNDGGGMVISTIHQQQQQQVAAQISLESSIFPDILRQVLLHPPPPPPSSDYSGAAGLLDSQLPPYQFMPGFSRTEPDAFSISTPPSSRLIDGSNTSTWLLDPPSSPESFWGCWDEITADFAAPPDISRAAE